MHQAARVGRTGERKGGKHRM
ncbi:rCG21101 [Rattus norvegicus]|nr:rCG21101 [Rattus norvegicus]